MLSIGNLPYDPTPNEQKLVAILQKNGYKPQGWGEIVAANGYMTVVAALKKIPGPVTGQQMRDTIGPCCGFETCDAAALLLQGQPRRLGGRRAGADDDPNGQFRSDAK